MRWMGVAAGIVVALGLSATSAQAKLEGALRQSFTGAAVKSCVAKQKTMALNQGISDNLLTGYCTCVSGYVADNASGDQLMLAAGDIQRGMPPAWLTEMEKQATAYCITNLRDYVKSN